MLFEKKGEYTEVLHFDQLQRFKKHSVPATCKKYISFPGIIPMFHFKQDLFYKILNCPSLITQSTSVINFSGIIFKQKVNQMFGTYLQN